MAFRFRKRYGVLVLIFGLVIVALLVHKPHKTVVPAAKPAGSYVALGDSVAAGVGLSEYSDSSACDRTLQAYPNIVAKDLNYSLTSVACSGATTTLGILGSQDVNKLAVSPQIDTLKKPTKPSLITITVGANDARWTTFIQKCYTSTCGDATDTAAVTMGLSEASQNLAVALDKVKRAYPDGLPKVIITGYYLLFAPTPIKDCPEMSGLTTAELQWIKNLQVSLNDKLETTAAQFNFAHFVPVAFSGHELCSVDPWIQGLNDPQPFHPTESGQNHIADLILQRVKK